MYDNRHGIPSASRSGTNKHQQFLMHADERSRGNYTFNEAYMPERTLLKRNPVNRNALEVCQGPNDEVYAVLVEPKPAGVTNFYAFRDVEVNVEMLNYDAMGTITRADGLFLSNNSVTRVDIVQPIFSGAD